MGIPGVDRKTRPNLFVHELLAIIDTRVHRLPEPETKIETTSLYFGDNEDTTTPGAGTGVVTGPASSTDNAITRWDGTTGTAIQDSTGILADNGNMTLAQSSASGAVPVLALTQADVDEPFLKVIGTAAAADLTRSIVDNGDVGAATLAGWIKVEVEDAGDQITDQDYFMPVYTLAAP